MRKVNNLVKFKQSLVAGTPSDIDVVHSNFLKQLRDTGADYVESSDYTIVMINYDKPVIYCTVTWYAP